VTLGDVASLAQARADTARERDEHARADTTCTQEENLLAVALILDRLYDTASPVDQLEQVEKLAPDEPLGCDECERGVQRAYRYGAFVLCRTCATRRLALLARLHAPTNEVAKPEVSQHPIERTAAA
jgi:hypothetical protein